MDQSMLSSTWISFRQLFVDFLADRNSRLGSEQGGLHAFYSRRLQLGRALLNNEEAAVRAIVSELPRYRTYVEIGAGFGQLACWLSICGFSTVAIERDRSRFAGLEELHARVARRWPEAGSRMRVLCDEFPAAAPEIDPQQALIISTNLIFGPSEETEQRLIEGIANHAAALVDTLRFCRDRTTLAEWAALDHRFAQAGLSDQRVVASSSPPPGEAAERIAWYRPAGTARLRRETQQSS